MDVHVAHRTVADVQLDEPRVVDGEVLVPREVTSRIEVRNAVDVDAATTYIVESFRRSRSGPPSSRPPAGARADLADPVAARGRRRRQVTDGDGPVAFNTDEMHGRLAVDHFLDVPAGSQGAFEVTSSARVPVAWDGRSSPTG
jgi:hypothetical protein